MAEVFWVIADISMAFILDFIDISVTSEILFSSYNNATTAASVLAAFLP